MHLSFNFTESSEQKGTLAIRSQILPASARDLEGKISDSSGSQATPKAGLLWEMVSPQDVAILLLLPERVTTAELCPTLREFPSRDSDLLWAK